MDTIYLISAFVLIGGVGGWWLHRWNVRDKDVATWPRNQVFIPDCHGGHWVDAESVLTRDEVLEQQKHGRWLTIDPDKCRDEQE